MRTYCIFEGGGAKGYAHVGVLRAIEQNNKTKPHFALNVQGYAGTSAGAILATLACVGYRSDDLIDPVRKQDLVSSLYGPDSRPLTLLGPGGKRVMKTAKGGALTQRAYRLKRPWAKPMHYCNGIARSFWTFCIRRKRGYSDTNNAREAIEKAIEKKFPGYGRASFAELKTQTGKHLRVIGANLSRRSLMVFSAEDTPDVVVSEAVSASIAIPGVFEPVVIEVPRLDAPGNENCLFVDGGIVSNLPAWVFDAERALDREAVTILSELSEPSAKLQTKLFALIGAIGRTAVFGASRLNVRGIGRSLLVSLPAPRDMLDFEPSWEELDRELNDACARASQVIEDDQAIRVWVSEIRGHLEQVCRDNGVNKGRFRASLATSDKAEPYVPEYAHGLVHLRFCLGYENDPDYRQVLSTERSPIWQVIRMLDDMYRVPDPSKVRPEGFLLLRSDFPDGLIDRCELDRKQASQIPKDLKWWLIIPLRILNKDFPYTDLAICLDGTENIPADREQHILQSVTDYVRHTLPAKMAISTGSTD